MSIDQHVNVTAVINNAGIARQGFGTIGVVSYDATWPDRKRTYRSLAAAIADGFAADGPEALSITRILGQSPHPIQVAVLRGTRKPTKQLTMNVNAIRNAFGYKAKVKGKGVTATQILYTSDASATQQEIHAGIVAQLNAVAGKNYTAAHAALVVADQVFTADSSTSTFTHAAHGGKTGDGPFTVANAGGALPTGLAAATNYWLIVLDANTYKYASSLANALAGTFVVISTNGTGVQTQSDVPGTTVRPFDPFTVTGDAAGNWFSVEPLNGDMAGLTIAETHADPGLTADLNEIQTADKNWYYFVTNFNSEAMVLAAAAYAEATPFKFYMAGIHDTDAENTAVNNGDLADQLGLLGYKRTLPIYSRKPDQCIDAGLAGRLAPLNVGTWTAAYKSVTGCVYDAFTDTQTDNLDGKRCSYYKLEADTSITWEGKVGNTAYGFMDVTVSLDFVIDDIQKSAFSVMKALDKVAYTDEDIALIRRAIEGAIDRAKSTTHKIISLGTPGSETDPEPTVTFPMVADIDPNVRALRQVPDGVVAFRLQGAVHSVNVTLTVTF